MPYHRSLTRHPRLVSNKFNSHKRAKVVRILQIVYLIENVEVGRLAVSCHWALDLVLSHNAVLVQLHID
jgi:hypothetical protein